MAHVAFRVYRDPKPQRAEWDSKGSYDGWHSCHDEWIPVFSPRIMPYMSRVGKPATEDI